MPHHSTLDVAINQIVRIMKTNKKKSILAELPAWASALIAMVIIFFFFFAVPESVSGNTTGGVIGCYVWG